MRAIDLFCGGGGLTNGLKAAGYKVLAAVENEPVAAETFRFNNPNTKLFECDIRTISGGEFAPKGGRLELLAACPPCQGFTSLTSKYNRDDPRNDLVTEVARLAKELKPRSIMIENVPRLANSPLGRKKLDPLLTFFEELGYKVSWYILNAKAFGVGQSRSRLVVFASSELIEAPEPETVGVNGIVDLRSKIGGMTDGAYVYEAKRAQSGQTVENWHCHRRMDAITLERLSYARPGGSRLDIPPALRPKCHKDSSTGFLNTYSRMSWDKPSPTITAGCLTLSKGRFGHPSENRTITLREAARLQDFPDDFVLPSASIEKNLRVIGNAFPANMARASAIELTH